MPAYVEDIWGRQGRSCKCSAAADIGGDAELADGAPCSFGQVAASFGPILYPFCQTRVPPVLHCIVSPAHCFV